MRKLPTRIMSRFFPHFFWRKIAGKRFKRERFSVVFTGLGQRPFLGGKVEPWRFFPPFFNRLSEYSVGYEFATQERDIADLTKETNVLVHVYREVTEADYVSQKLPKRSGVVELNHPRFGEIIADKVKSNLSLKGAGCLMPEMKEGFSEETVFSNENKSSGAEVSLLGPGYELDNSRYNTSYIDSRIVFGGIEYYTCVRAMCVGSEVIHAWCRARPVSDGSPSVHSKDTPLDANLIEFLQAEKVNPFWSDFEDIASIVNKTLGFGFYSLDIIVDNDNYVFLIEPGYKFNDATYVEHLRPLADKLPSHEILFTDEFARRSADAFVRLIDKEMHA